ncbi:GNAT family N-acetyltransferase [Yoonia sp.]|uniref:GNAT family N-acetyltransferase n=1 Tax=Yoonia sp. TaxID=2212373 RepID=UPI0019FB40C3|nr:GNAT family N-acetyltransferase [Yoonia sp.]MBE0412403.1 GNAT family N-acetyltransferase [Yoonia sp.]
MIRALPADLPAITAFLRRQLPLAFYPLTNLTCHGLGTDHPKAMRFWLWHDQGELTDVLGVTGAGFLFPVFNTDVVRQTPALLNGTRVTGIGGAPDTVAELRIALCLRAPPVLDFTEPVYCLPLGDLVMPQTDGLCLQPLVAAPIDLLVNWRAAFLMETQGNAVTVAQQRARHDLKEISERDTYRVLMDGAQPVAMTGFNAAFADVVQVGGVFVPPHLRGCGFGRISVALHLAQARAEGVCSAYLAAASVAAARAYAAIGFQRQGSYAAVVYEEGQMVHG